ncbi:type III-B CRISPR module RAMP protein Cmr6 [Psychrobacter immobilis]|uniref:type III-B CRISPR module RAMP protein Cmr6 n=1 Tax=Psychrobacter immobilis TaxID=498 RepID=UPI0019183857|nr:type III-B CRISPR module RAMP protein Cmr6 [Psychrobacter immobilis]
MQLMRENLRPLMQSLNSAHAGLLIQRALPIWEDGDRPQKQALVQTIAGVKPDNIYNLAFKRWLKLTQECAEFATTVATLNGRLFTGLPLGGTLETGVSTHHTYGMPLLAGSSIKGAVRSYAQSIGIDAKVIQVLFGSDDDATPNAGYLIWHDAWWIPNTSTQTPFVKEMVTVHHQQYYKGTKTQADDTERPSPNLQTAVQGSFYFVIEGVHAWVEYAKQLLDNMLTEQGLGAKTASGYGYFLITPDVISNQLAEIEEEQAHIKEKERNKDKSAEQILLDDFKDYQTPEVFVFYGKVLSWSEEQKFLVKEAYELIIKEPSVKKDKNNKWVKRLPALVEKLKGFGINID